MRGGVGDSEVWETADSDVAIISGLETELKWPRWLTEWSWSQIYARRNQSIISISLSLFSCVHAQLIFGWKGPGVIWMKVWMCIGKKSPPRSLFHHEAFSCQRLAPGRPAPSQWHQCGNSPFLCLLHDTLFPGGRGGEECLLEKRCLSRWSGSQDIHVADLCQGVCPMLHHEQKTPTVLPAGPSPALTLSLDMDLPTGTDAPTSMLKAKSEDGAPRQSHHYLGFKP